MIKMETNFGTITIELDADKAPVTVENFKKYIADEFFDNTIFHRVIPNFMIQGGGFNPGMGEITSLISKLMENGYAYQTKTGDICFRVRKFDEYGKLSGESLDDLQAGARVDAETSKDDPLDFVLWKQAKDGEPSWQSEWGDGRPGWHIECSAMSMSSLGENFDIHGGGQDLRFPHHENEIAQSECATGHPFVNLWMHNGFVRIDDEKMSKSLDNFFTIRDVLDSYHPEILRYFIINSHYRSPLNYSDETLDQSKAALEGYYLALEGLDVENSVELDDEISAPFLAAMDDILDITSNRN